MHHAPCGAVVSIAEGQLKHWFTVAAVVSKVKHAVRPPINGKAYQLISRICLSCSAFVRSITRGSQSSVAIIPNTARACTTGCASFRFCKDIHKYIAVIKILKLIALLVMKDGKTGTLADSLQVMPKTIRRDGVAVVMRFDRKICQLHGETICPAQFMQAESVVLMRRGYAEAVAVPKVSDESH